MWGQHDGLEPAELGPRVGLSRRGGRGRLRARSTGAGPQPPTCTPRRCCSPPATDDVRHRGDRPCRPRASRSRSRRCCGWRGDPPPRPRRLRPRSSIAGAGLVSTRLSIVDLARRLAAADAATAGSVLVYNGEVYNHPELRARARAAGRRFKTRSDTEVVHALLEHEGLAALDRLNGQFAFAWWQPRRRRLTLVRDRFGVRPLTTRPAPTAASSSGRRRRRSSRPARSRAAADLAGTRPGASRCGRRGRRGRRSPASASSRRAACSSGSAAGSWSGAAGGPPVAGGRGAGRGARGPAARQRRACGCEPTSPSAPTSPADSTRA